MNEIYFDAYRYTKEKSLFSVIKLFFKCRAFRKTVYYRKFQKAGPFKRIIIKLFNHSLSNKMSIDLPFTCKIGRRLLMIHPYNIVFNSHCEIGDNCTILKGATIGNSKTGKVGAPKIGDNVYIGLNSSVVGGIKIGNNVLIAANTFVNFDVPDNSIVLGSPGVIHAKDNASYEYICNSIFEMDKI